MTSPVLEIRGLRKSFDTTSVLCGLDIRLDEGITLGLVGPNGAGKTTCLRCIMGLVFADDGEIDVAGIDAIADPVAARLQIGYLPGETSVYRWMRGSDFLKFGLAFHEEIDEDFVKRCLDRFDLPIERPLRSYSSGQKQMLALTIALGPVVPLYILDEPEKALDASKRHVLREILAEMRDRGRTIVVSSHHIAELEQFSDEYAFLHDGVLLDRADVEQRKQDLARHLRVRFDGDRAPRDLPAGTRVERSDRDWVLEAPPGADPRKIAETLLAQQPTRLEVGEPTLQEVYESLYLADGSHAAREERS